MMEDLPDILTINELMVALQLSKSTLIRYMRRKNNPMPFVRLCGKTLRFVKKDVIEWMYNNS